MPIPDISGRWQGGNEKLKHFEVQITMNDNQFNAKAVTFELTRYWVAGAGQIHESGKFEVTFSRPPNPPPHPVPAEDIFLTGYLGGDGKLHFSNGEVWTR